MSTEERVAKRHEKRLEKLKKIALRRGVVQSVNKAQRRGDFFLLNKLHDALVNELNHELISKGRVEKL